MRNSEEFAKTKAVAWFLALCICPVLVPLFSRFVYTITWLNDWYWYTLVLFAVLDPLRVLFSPWTSECKPSMTTMLLISSCYGWVLSSSSLLYRIATGDPYLDMDPFDVGFRMLILSVLYMIMRSSKRVLHVDGMSPSIRNLDPPSSVRISLEVEGNTGKVVNNMEKTLQANDLVMIVDKQTGDSRLVPNHRQGFFSLTPMILLLIAALFVLPLARILGRWKSTPVSEWTWIHSFLAVVIVVLVLWMYVNHLGFESTMRVVYDTGSGILFTWIMWLVIDLVSLWYGAMTVRTKPPATTPTSENQSWDLLLAYGAVLALSSFVHGACNVALTRMSTSFLFARLLFPVQLWSYLSQNMAYGLQGWSQQLASMLVLGAVHQVCLVSGMYSKLSHWLFRHCSIFESGITSREDAVVESTLRILFEVQILMQETVAELQTYGLLAICYATGLIPEELGARLAKGWNLWLTLGLQATVRIITWILSRYVLRYKLQKVLQEGQVLLRGEDLSQRLPGYVTRLLGLSTETSVVVQRLVQRFRMDIPEWFWTGAILSQPVGPETINHMLRYRDWFPSILRKQGTSFLVPCCLIFMYSMQSRVSDIPRFMFSSP